MTETTYYMDTPDAILMSQRSVAVDEVLRTELSIQVTELSAMPGLLADVARLSPDPELFHFLLRPLSQGVLKTATLIVGLKFGVEFGGVEFQGNLYEARISRRYNEKLGNHTVFTLVFRKDPHAAQDAVLASFISERKTDPATGARVRVARQLTLGQLEE